jgi:hypothetical protein
MEDEVAAVVVDNGSGMVKVRSSDLPWFNHSRLILHGSLDPIGAG